MYKTINEEISGLVFKESCYPHGWPTHDICPCCNSNRISPAFHKTGMSLWKCAQCAFVFMNPYPSDSVLEKLYNCASYPAIRQYIEIPKAKKSRSEISCSVATDETQALIQYINRHKPEGTWLDVGGGIGSFLHCVNNLYPQYTTYLNETSRVSAEFAKEYYNLQITPSAPDKIFESGLRFDVITAIAVLEHLALPKQFLHSYFSLLKPGGIFVLLIPRFSRMARAFIKEYSYNVIPPFHLSYFDTGSLKTVLESIPDVESINIWDSGCNCFSFSDLNRLNGYVDIEIPTEECDKLKVICTKPVPRVRQRIAGVLDKMDSKFGKIIRKIDGGALLNASIIRAK